MAVDPYGPCPCGSGKKLKFCCSDLVGEIEKIHRMIEGDQTRAALAHVEQTLRKHPRRASLLDLKIMLELALGDLDAAERSLEEFRAIDPQNPSMLAQQAIIASQRGDVPTAVNAIQEALALVQQELPMRILEALGVVGHALLLTGHIIGAQAHLWLFQGIAGQDDTRALELIVRLNQTSGLPLLLRDQLYLKEVPADQLAYRIAAEAADLSYEGKWKLALAKLNTLPEDQAAHPSVIYNRAVLNGWLGNTAAMVEGLHRFAQLDVPLDDAVEAEAVAQLLDSTDADDSIEIVEQSYAVRNEEELVSRLLSDRRLHPYALSQEEIDAESGPPPRHSFMVLDRAAPKSGMELKRDDVPLIVGDLAYYGRQTDAPERLVLVTDRDEGLKRVEAEICEIAGDALGDVVKKEVVDRRSKTEQALSWRWYMPVDTPLTKRRELIADERREAMLGRWPDTPRAALEGKTPRQAATDPALRVRLLASLLILGQGTNHQQGPLISELRSNLGLPAAEPIDPATVEAIRLPLVRIPRLMIEKVDDDTLVQLFRRSVLTGAEAATLHIGREIVRRPSMHDHQIEEAYERMLPLVVDAEAALALLQQARAWCDSRGESNVRWDFLEMGIYIDEGRPEDASRLLQHIQQEHVNEPGVAQQLYNILYSLGIIKDGPARAPRAAAASAARPAPAPGEPGSIWTPDADAPRERSAIWTPS